MPVLGASGGASFYGSTTTATASGAIADGDPVALNAAGPVSKVSPNGKTSVARGDKFFVIGSGGDAVLEFDVSTPFDISTASYTSTLFSVAAYETAPQSMVFNNNGTRMFVVGALGDDIIQYVLPDPYAISSAIHERAFSVATQTTTPTGVVFNFEGTKMFVGSGSTLFMYNLTQPYDVGTASYSGTSFDFSTQGTTSKCMRFNNDGTKLFVVQFTNQDIDEYNLSTPYDISTMSYSQNLSVSAQDTQPVGIDFNFDGTKMYMTGIAGDNVYEYDLTTGFDLSTASYSGSTLNLTGLESTPLAGVFAQNVLTTNAESYLGIADGAYADGATATIQLAGAIDDAQSGLTAGKTYYLQGDGSLSTTKSTPLVEAGFALSPTTLLVKGAYSSVTAKADAPTPLADYVPAHFGIDYNDLLNYSAASLYNTTIGLFWSGLDQQGAYIIESDLSDFTEVVNVTGSGILGTVITGAFATALQTAYIEVTIDGEVRVWEMLLYPAFRSVLSFSPLNLLERSGVNHVTTATNSVSGFDSTYTTPYSAMYTDYGTLLDDFYVQPATITGGIRFKENMRVRIKGTTTFNTSNLRHYHGVIYAVYN